MSVVVAVIVGLMLGSFLSVLLDRWPHWRGAGMGRSKCPHCDHTLAWFDLLPVLSWLMVRGKCRYCRQPISALYPVLELTMASVLGVYVYLFGMTVGWPILNGAILFSLVSLFYFDLKHQMLPDVIVASLGVFAVLRAVFTEPDRVSGLLITGLCLAAAFGALYAVSRGRWLGFGDVKLAFVMGALFGYPIGVSVTLIAVWAGALFGVAIMLTRKGTMQTALPFGSFWTAAAVITMLWPGPAHMLSSVFIPAF